MGRGATCMRNIQVGVALSVILPFEIGDFVIKDESAERSLGQMAGIPLYGWKVPNDNANVRINSLYTKILGRKMYQQGHLCRNSNVTHIFTI